MSGDFQLGPHPDVDQLNAFVENALPDHERQETLAHLAVCADCRAIAALSVIPAASKPEPVRKPWFIGWKLAFAAVPAIAALILLVIYVSRSGNRAVRIASPPPGPVAAVSTSPEAAPVSKPRPRPSPSLPILSAVSNESVRLVVDRRNAVFFSPDEGRHWKLVHAIWKGRAVRIALAGAPAPTPQAAVSTGVIPAVTNAAVTGIVSDPTGAVVPGATIEVTNPLTSQVHSAVTDSEGRYRIEGLAPGSYQISSTAPGFEKQELAADLTPARPTVANLTLRVGASSDTVTVTITGKAEQLTPVTGSEKPTAAIFEMTTDTGDLWVSADGKNWKRQKK